jgi:hypothetical protein
MSSSYSESQQAVDFCSNGLYIFSSCLYPPKQSHVEKIVKARTYKEGVRIGKTPKKLDSIRCPQYRETKADTLKQLSPLGEGDQELEKRLVREELT